MTIEARTWLPDDALTAERIEGALIDSVREWTERWFDGCECSLAARGESGKTLSNPGEEIRIEGTAVTATLAGRGKRLLLEAALDKRLPDDMNADDHALLDTFVRQIAEDLSSICDRGLAVPAGTSDHFITLVLLLKGTEVCKLACDRQAMVGRIRAQLGEPATRSTPLTGRSIALGPTSIALEGILGGIDLALDDLENLAAGDVLILDRDLDSPIPVRICASRMDVGRGTLGHREGRPTIAF